MAEKIQLVTLKEYIDERERVLTAIGVFTALAIFWSSLPVKETGASAAFWCLLATIPLYHEVLRGFSFKQSTWPLIVFMNLLPPIFYHTISYVLIVYRPQWYAHLPTLFLWILAAPIWSLYKRYDVRKRLELKLFQRRNEESPWHIDFCFDAAVFSFILAFAITVAPIPANFINRRLDNMYKDTVTKTPTPVATVPSISPTPTPTSQPQS